MKAINHFFTIGLLAILLSACGGSTTPISDPVKDPDPSGKFSLIITDADGDFLSYTVDVNSIQLTKTNGTVVETTPINSRINFADYTDLSEFFSVMTLPEGIYNKITLNLDYSNAEIVIQDDQGNSYTATAVDANGNPLSQFALDVNLGDNDAVRITNGKIAFLTVDFDLAASNTILGFDPAQVEVEPFLLATADVIDNRDHRARGLLNQVDTANNLITINIRPFHLRQGDFGQLQAQANDETQYEINGETFSGMDGLNQLATLSAGEPIIIQGQIFTADRTFVANEVYAGTSVPWNNSDVVRGVVVSRSGDTLTIRGAHAEIGGNSVTFRDVILVNLFDTTTVTKQLGSDVSLDKDSISVGSRIIATGTLDNTSNTLDTSEGFARLRLNSVKGQVTQAQPLQMRLTRINGRPVRIFDFTGSGIDPTNDVDTANFEIDTQTLTLNSVTANDWLRVRGFFNSFGAAPTDYIAKTVSDLAVDRRASGFIAGWRDGSADVFTELNADSIVINTSNAIAFVKIAGIPAINVAADTPFVIKPVANDRSVYAIKHAGDRAITVYHNMAEFSRAVQTELDNGLLVLKTAAIGRYDQQKNEFTSIAFSVLFN